MRLPIRAKMVLFIGLPALAIAVGALIWILGYVRAQSRRIQEQEMTAKAENAAARFDDYISKAARIGETTARFLTRFPDFNEEQLYGLLRDNVGLNHRVYGAAVAFEPGTFKKDSSLFCPYVYEGDGGLVAMDLTREVLDWYGDEKWQWWHRPKNSRHGEWTDPYLDDGAGNILMTTYAVPFYTSPGTPEERGKFRGVTTIDIDLERLRKNIGEEIVGDREFFILEPQGRYIYTKDTRLILKETVYDSLEGHGRGDLVAPMQRVLGGSSGVELVSTNDGEERFFAYAPIPSTGWIFVTSVPKGEVMSEFNRIMQFVMVSFVVAITLIAAAILFMSGRLTRPIGLLRERVLRIAHGEAISLDDYHTGDELEELAGAFGTMQAKVADRERQLETARETALRELLESAPDAMIVATSAGMICRVNSQAGELFGYGFEELVGASVEILIPERDRNGVGKELMGHLAAPALRDLGAGMELFGRRKDGSEIPVEVGLSPFHEPEGLMTVTAIRDITERKKYEAILKVAREQAEAANRAKSDFLSHMSHELRTPLNGILGYAQILQRGEAVTEDQRTSLDAIVNCGDHLLSLINDVLDLSKIEAGRIEVARESCDLHKLVKGVGDIVSQRASGKGISFELEVSPEVPRGVITDAPKLRQIFVNLLGNAVKFTNEGGVTFHVAETPKGTLRFDVVDTGLGMDEAELQVIFDPFKQVEGGKSEGGTGLGLAITKQLAEALGGHVTVTSRKGSGSTFSVMIPLEEVDEQELSSLDAVAAPGAGNLVLAPGQDLTILVADDRSTNRDILDQMLRHAGFKTIMADDGDTALERLHAHPVDLVLMDVRMPRLNGIEALREIRGGQKNNEVPVIAVTASVFPEFRKKALEAGFNDFLGKPFRASELMEVIRRILDLRFVEQVPPAPPEAAGPEAESSIGDLSPEMRERLQAALKIRNLTAIKAIAAELADEAGTAEVAERVGRMVRRFDFDGLKKLLDE